MRPARLLGVAVAAVLAVTACNGGTDLAPNIDPSTTTGPGSITSEVGSPSSTTPGAAIMFGCESDAREHRYMSTLPQMTLTPNPVEAGSRAILRVGPSWLEPGDWGVVGWGVAWECWNGSEWVSTHLLEHGRDPSAPGTVVAQEPGVPGTMPAIGIGVPNTFTITIPDVPPGWYQLRETVVGGGGGDDERYKVVSVEVIAPGESFAFDDVVSTIEATGVTVVEAGTAPGAPFTVDARLLDVRGHRVRVYEYPDVVAQVEETATIAMEGWSVRGTPVEWIAPPVYWAKGRVIVLSLGQDSEPIGILAEALGDMLRLGPSPPPDWTFFGEVTHIEWTGDHIVNLPVNRWNLGPRDVTLADGQVLRFPADDQRARWCWPVDPDVWSQDVDGCWIAGTVGENGEVTEWRAFEVSERLEQEEVVGYGFHTGMRIDEVVDSVAIVRGYPIPIAEDASGHLGCCPVRYTELEDVDDLDVWVYFDTERQEITDIRCLCEW